MLAAKTRITLRPDIHHAACHWQIATVRSKAQIIIREAIPP